MAKIRLKLGESEIEVDSRDFYVDNNSLAEVIQNISHLLQKNRAKIVFENDNQDVKYLEKVSQSNYGLEQLDDAEVFESEFNEPKLISFHEIKAKLRILETSGFFNSPRTVAETVQQLREYGWATNSLDVSKSLAKMASNREIYKNSEENRAHYFVQKSLAVN